MSAEARWGNAEERNADHTFQAFMATAKGLYMSRYHLLVLTEVVRLGVRPNEDGALVLDKRLDQDMREQAFNYVLSVYPEDFHFDLIQRKSEWTTPQ